MAKGKIKQNNPKYRTGNEVIERLARVKVRFCSHLSFSPSPCSFPSPVPHFSSNILTATVQKLLFNLYRYTVIIKVMECYFWGDCHIKEYERRLTYFVQYLLTMLGGAWYWICWRVLKASESLRVWHHNDNITFPLIYQISCVKRKRPCCIIEKKAVCFFLGELLCTRGFSKGRFSFAHLLPLS